MHQRNYCCTRRHLLTSGTMSVGSLAAAWLLQQDGLFADTPKQPLLEEVVHDLSLKAPHFEPKAKAMISIFLIGGPSNLDLFDPKPTLTRLDGQDFPGQPPRVDNPVQRVSKILGPCWLYRRWGQCGMELAEILPHIGGIADDITLIRSMVTGVNNHIPSMYALNTGRAVPGRPTLGSWLTYGLGSENQNLPAFLNLTHPAGLPLIGGENWTNGYLPSIYQGTTVRANEPRVPNLDPPAHLQGSPQDRQLQYLTALNRDHRAQHPGETDLQARIASYELAAKMQTEARAAFDISGESKETQRLYGIDQEVTRDYGTRCLIARRLVERGVRFVQLFNVGQSWDQHSHIRTQLPKLCQAVDQPAAALVTDLKRRGLLDSTVVFWGGEMGRMPMVQAAPGTPEEKYGRDHNTNGFSVWLAGGGFKGGHVHGVTDELGLQPVQDPVTHTDFQTTLFHLFGLDLNKLVYKRGFQELSLTDGDQTGQIIKAILS